MRDVWRRAVFAGVVGVSSGIAGGLTTYSINENVHAARTSNPCTQTAEACEATRQWHEWDRTFFARTSALLGMGLGGACGIMAWGVMGGPLRPTRRRNPEGPTP